MRLDSFYFIEVRNLMDGGYEWKLEKLFENDIGNICCLFFFWSICGVVNIIYSLCGLLKLGWLFLVG